MTEKELLEIFSPANVNVPKININDRHKYSEALKKYKASIIDDAVRSVPINFTIYILLILFEAFNLVIIFYK